MKKASLKLLSLFIAIMMATVLLPVQIAKASRLSDGKFYFDTMGSNATITGLVDGTMEILVIPETISDGANEYNVTSIGYFAFTGCTGLTGTLTIPDNIISIGSYAFQGCTGLSGFILGKGLTTIGENAFTGCTSLKNIDVNIENQSLSSSDGIVYDKSQSSILIYPPGRTGQLSLLDGITSIGDYAFYSCNGLSGPLTLPESVTSIGDYAFYSCRNLTGPLIIPDGVSSIGEYAFYTCNLLTGPLTIPDSVTSIGQYAFYNCGSLSGPLTLPNGLITIEKRTFSGCEGFTGPLIIPDSVITIGSYAFHECQRLSSLTIGNSVKTIGEAGFEYCRGLTGSLIIPDSVIAIGSYAFAWCLGLSELTLGNSLTTIGNETFSNCTKINTITSKPVNAPTTDFRVFNGVPSTTVLYTPNTPSSNRTYDVSPWSYFTRGAVQPIEYQISFISNGGTEVVSQTVPHDGYAMEPTSPNRTGYLFAGWFTEPEFNIQFDFTTPITSDLMLYAKWDAVDAAPFIKSQPQSTTILVGESATFTVEYEAFPEPSIQWQFSKNGGKKWSVIPGASEATLHVPNVTAGMNGYKYRVILDNGVAAPVQSEVATLTVTPGSADLAIILNSIYDRAGNVIHWTGTATNAGPDSALNVIVNFVLPKNTKLSNIGTINYQVKGHTIKINLGTIQTNSSVEFSVDVIPTSQAKFPIASTANATTTSLDENLTNNSVSAEVSAQ